MSHLSIITIITICISPVLSDEHLTTHLLNEVPASCRSRYQTEQDVKQLKTCLRNEVVTLKRPASVTNIQEFCKQDISICFRQLEDVLKPCLTDEKIDKIFGNLIKAVEGGFEYACAYNGLPLIDFMEKGSCLNSNHDVRLKGLECSMNSPINMANQSMTLDFSSEETCRELIKLTMCLMDASDICHDKTGREFFKNLVLSMLNRTPCKSFTHELYMYTPTIPTSEKSFAPTCNINILLLAFLACSNIILNGAM